MERKADLMKVNKMNDNKADKTDLNKTNNLIDNLNERVKHLSVLLTELAGSLEPIKNTLD